MEDEGLDPLNEIHLAALHHIYLPLINEKLKVWSRARSRHRMRTNHQSVCGYQASYKIHWVLNWWDQP